MQKILIVEDEDLMFEIYEHALEKQGYEVLRAKDGIEALAMISSNKPDLILTDLLMPNMSGFELVRRLHEMKANIPTIVATALGALEPDQMNELSDNGVSGISFKPTNMREINIQLERAKRRFNGQQER